MQENATPLVIGVAGGSGSGKTTLAKIILERLDAETIAFLQHDAYYKELDDLPPNQRISINFDHPNSLDTDLLISHIHALKSYRAVDVPVYDFITYTRTGKSIHVEPKPVIMVEGILIFAEARLRKLFDVKIFVDTDADLRFIRRLERDINERSRSPESVIRQWLSTVRPMHLEFVEPSKRYADVIFPNGGLNTVALEMVVARIEGLVRAKRSISE